MLLLQLNLQAAAGGIDVSSATTDAADISAGSVSPVIASSSATTDGQDVTAASVATSISVTSATTDSVDITAANVDVVGAGVSFSSATTDAPDTTAGSVAIGISVSSATTNAADTTAGQVSPVIAASSTTTNAPDTTAAQVAPQIAASSATVNAADITAAAISVAALVATGGGANVSSGVYPGYATEQNKPVNEQATEPAKTAFTDKPSGLSPVSIPVYPVATSGKALRQVTNAALRDKQIQALGRLTLSLQTTYAQQQADQQRLEIDNHNDDAIIAILLTL